MIAVNGTNVYWTSVGFAETNIGPVMKGATSGVGYATILAYEVGRPAAIAADATAVYWGSHDGGVVKCAVDGCDWTPSILAGNTYPNAIAVDATGVYWTSGNGAVMKLGH